MTQTVPQQLAEELRTLRALTGPLSASKFAQTPRLMLHLGAQTQASALESLQQFGIQHNDDVNILTALLTIGYDQSGETVQDRFSEAAKRYHVVDRTIRRRSDLGIDRLAELVARRSSIDRAEFLTFLSQGPDRMIVWSYALYPPTTRVRSRPSYYFDESKHPFILDSEQPSQSRPGWKFESAEPIGLPYDRTIEAPLHCFELHIVNAAVPSPIFTTSFAMEPNFEARCEWDALNMGLWIRVFTPPIRPFYRQADEESS